MLIMVEISCFKPFPVKNCSQIGFIRIFLIFDSYYLSGFAQCCLTRATDRDWLMWTGLMLGQRLRTWSKTQQRVNVTCAWHDLHLVYILGIERDIWVLILYASSTAFLIKVKEIRGTVDTT